MNYIDRKPSWLKKTFSTNSDFFKVRKLLSENHLNTICSEALCPNKNECWSKKFCTFLILGNKCTRHCRFCNVKASKRGTPINVNESLKIVEVINKLGLKYVVITSVTRDDLPDGGASEFAKIVKSVALADKTIKVELLIPDLEKNFLDLIIAANPFVIGHNIETIERLTPLLRDKRCQYRKSLSVLEYLAKKRGNVKSSLMVGLGEKDFEVIRTLKDLYNSGVSIVTIGQYLRPSIKHFPVMEYVKPSNFEYYKDEALAIGFNKVFSAPFVRSSYMAESLFENYKHSELSSHIVTGPSFKSSIPR